MKYFYVIYINDDVLKNFLNAIRLLGNPLEKHDTHITIRGPYSKPIDKRMYDSTIENDTIRTTSIDTFFNTNQNTVILRCDSERLRQVWSKPDYGFNPHITLYDGKSRHFAEQLLKILNSHLRNFKFKVNKLYELRSEKGETNEPITVDTTLSYIKKIVGDRLSRNNLEKMDESEKLLMIEFLTEDLALYRSKSRLFTEIPDSKVENQKDTNNDSSNYELFPDYLKSHQILHNKLATLNKDQKRKSR